MAAPAGGGPNTFKGPGGKSKGGRGSTSVKAAFIPRGPAKGVKQAPDTHNGGVNDPRGVYNPLANLAGPPLKQAAQNIANVQVQGPINDARGQIKQNNQQSAATQKTDFSYYMQLAQAAKDAYAQQQQQGTALQGQLAGINTATQGQLAQLGQQASGGALARMNALGLDAGQTQALAADTAQQQGTGSLMGQAALNQGATTSASSLTNMNSLRGATGLRGIETIGAQARASRLANQPLNQKIADLQASRGTLAATALGQLRTQERNYQIAQEGLQATATTAAAKLALQRAQDIAGNNLKKLGILTTSRDKAAALLVTERGQDITAKADAARIDAILSGQKVTAANDLANQILHNKQLAQKTNNDQLTQAWHQSELNLKQGGTGQISVTAQNAIWKTLGEVTNAIPRLRQQGLKQGNKVVVAHPDAAQIKSLLGTGYDPTIIEAAYELLGWGAILPQTAQALQRMGLNLANGSFRNAPLRVKVQSVTPSGPTGGH